MDARHLRKSTTLPQCSLCMRTPPITTTTTTTTISCFQGRSFPPALFFFLQGHFESRMCCWMCGVFTDVPTLAPAASYISLVRGREFIACPYSLCVHLRVNHICEVPIYRYSMCISDFSSSLLSVLSCVLVSHAYFSSEVNTYWALHEKGKCWLIHNFQGTCTCPGSSWKPVSLSPRTSINKSYFFKKNIYNMYI